MEFLNPAALYGLSALPLLLIPYLIRKRPRRQVVSSLLFFTEFGSSAAGRPWGKLLLPPIFFLQLLLLLLLILALSEPVFSVRPAKIAIVLDNSASMQTMEEGKGRFALAQEQARAVLAELGATATVDIYLAVPRLEKLQSRAFSPSEAGSAIAPLQPYDVGDAGADFSNLLSRMAREQSYERIYFFTDHPVRGQSATIRAVSVGRAKGNLAIVSFQISRASLASSRLEASAEVANFSPNDANIKVALKGTGGALSTRELVVPAGKNATATFEQFPLNPYYEAEIQSADALPVDNRRYALPPASQNLRILAISPRPQALASLRSIPGVSLDIISPAEYEKAGRSGTALELFHFSMPSVLPSNPALFVLPPDENPLVRLEKPVSGSVVSGWRDSHPLTRYVNFSLFRPSYARPLKPIASGEPIIEIPQGPLAIAFEQRGFHYLVLGFDPFPYLGRENLPVSIFTLNLLDWFFERSGGRGKTTGESLTFKAARQGEFLLTPKGAKHTLNAGATFFSGTYDQGIYQMNRGGENDLFAINLQSGIESDLRDPPAIELQDGSGVINSPSLLFSFWPYLLMASLLLLILEWFLNPPLFRPALRWRSN